MNPRGVHYGVHFWGFNQNKSKQKQAAEIQLVLKISRLLRFLFIRVLFRLNFVDLEGLCISLFVKYIAR